MKDRFNRNIPKQRVCNNNQCKLFNMNVVTDTSTIFLKDKNRWETVDACSRCGEPVKYIDYPQDYIDNLTTTELNKLVKV